LSPKGIIANSFPKSGTHLLTELLSQMGYNQANTHLSRSLLVYGPKNFIRNLKIYFRREKIQDKGVPIDIENPKMKIKRIWLKTHIENELMEGLYSQAHLPYSKKLEAVIEQSGHKMLFIHRHPLDVLTSLKNYIINKKNHPNHKMLVNCTNDEERFLLLINGYSGNQNAMIMAPFFKKYQYSIGWAQSNSVCSLSFEEIIGINGGGSEEQQRNSIIKVFKYLNYDLKEVDRIQSKVYNTKSATFHKGTTGQWKTELTPKVLNICKLKMMEANIDVDEYFALT
tara:strand:- start:3280 stop:4128 length:849 start_codon:yes stop_codon:yes gene_type:complete